MTDILSIGEILIDLTQTGSEHSIPQYAANPGGAPANVAVAAAKMGASAAFIGKVGQDAFGALLRRTLIDNGVSDTGLFETAYAPTTLAVVSVDGKGERSFSFYRDNSADTLLTETEALSVLSECPKVLHFGSVSLTVDPSRSATLSAVQTAKKLGAIISYDPNYRPSLWPDESTATRWMKAPLELVDILKVSDEELPLLAGTPDLKAGSQTLLEAGAKLVLVTMGDNGVFYRTKSGTGHVPAVPTQVADTNGAGDTFFGAVLSRLSLRGAHLLDRLTTQELEHILVFANRAASLTCSRSGAIPAMPTLQELV